VVENAPAVPQEQEKISLAEFLETSPPDTQLHVDHLAAKSRSTAGLELNEADIHLPCNSEKCEGKGELHFVNTGGSSYLEREKWKFAFASYHCRNCRDTMKTFALVVRVDPEGYSGAVLKLGETPAFGPQVPARVITLIGPDREIFLSGRRAENRGLGIGAFAYYRRVVENQKSRIIQEMARVAKKLEASEHDLKLFEDAVKETQFSAAIDKIRAAIPSALKIDGHNPLSLLHSALSDGLHERSDEECLECAREIRLVLTELAERMAQVLKEKSELKDAVSKLLVRTASKKPSSPAEPSEK
jgi:hypothetical protein